MFHGGFISVHARSLLHHPGFNELLLFPRRPLEAEMVSPNEMAQALCFEVVYIVNSPLRGKNKIEACTWRCFTDRVHTSLREINHGFLKGFDVWGGFFLHFFPANVNLYKEKDLPRGMGKIRGEIKRDTLHPTEHLDLFIR